MAGGAAVSNNPEASAYSHLIDSSPWWKKQRVLLLNAWIVVLLITSSTNGYDGSMMNGLQSLSQWNSAFNYPTGGQLGLLNAIQNIGSLCAYPFSPYVADYFGGRFAVGWGACLMASATIIQTASQNVNMFIGARWLIGFGLTFAANGAPLLITEVAYPSQRGQATSLYNSLWFLGSIIAAWTTFGTFNIPTSWSWRIPSAIQGLPSVIQLCLLWFVPESPRWLVSKGREEEALKTLAYYHANGNEEDPLVEYEFQEIKAAIALDREVKDNVGWLSLFKTPGNRRRVRIIVALAFFSQWSGNGLTSYFTNPTTQLLINGLLNIYNFCIAMVASVLCDKAGRRLLFITSTVGVSSSFPDPRYLPRLALTRAGNMFSGMLIFWTLQTVCFALYSEYDLTARDKSCTMVSLRAVDRSKVAHSPIMQLAFTPLIVTYTVEILPYSLRSKGFTMFNFVLSLSLIFNQYVNPIALQALGWKYYIVYICWIAFEMVFVFFFIVETKNRTLEETAALFDGDDSVAAIAHPAAEIAEGPKPGDVRVDGEKKESSSAVDEVELTKV
ncbi:hypothetical protein JAAARDRAFT_195418 [Jaapia argillacea MUCL 33604]|uniref:Major facilitator superfamily (MFS) profile domain-containing protein n=1 Tax=Jaapia argillacea MUCL 33604 TaxID=933084 RepID=A0A067PYY5_9AGAM|nr:hypothetical protein JAAARDRAFT_195418 [Jaapia argillacea MUCL 33604]